MVTMKYSYHEDENIIELAPEGEVNIKDILNYGNELINKGIMKHDTIEYVDMSNMTNLIVDYNSAHQLITMHKKWLECGWLGSVYFTPKEFEVGIVNMVGSIIKAQPDAELPEGLMTPSREKIPINKVRDFLLCQINS